MFHRYIRVFHFAVQLGLPSNFGNPSMIKQRPILFSGAMVRAILDGRKTQTRRAVKLPHNNHLGTWEPMTIGGPNGGRTADGRTIPLQGGIWHTRTGECLASPYGQPGDRLWVRETTKARPLLNVFTGEAIDLTCGAYVADDEPVLDERRFDLVWWYSRKTCPAIHMPRAACRLVLEVTGVRVERLNDCSEADAAAEGVEPYAIYGGKPASWKGAANMTAARDTAREAYRDLWDSINGAGAWDANPWVWIVEFRRV